MYLDASNLYGWEMSQKLPLERFKWEINASRFDEKFIKKYDENSNQGHLLDVTINYPKTLHNLHNDLPFLPERMKIDKCDKLVCNLYDKKLCCSHKSFKTSIRSWISLLKSSQSN